MFNRSYLNRVRPGLFLLIALMLLSGFLAIYSGKIESSDTLRIFDASSSLANFGDLGLDESLWQAPPQTSIDRSEAYPLLDYEPNESLIAYSAALFYQLAAFLPTMGLVHFTYLLNIFWTTATALLLMAFVKRLGYDSRLAVLAASLFAFTTIAWIYSKSLFREPQVAFCLLLTAYSIESWRKRHLNLLWLILASLAFTAAFFTKNSAIMALPALILLALPEFKPTWLKRLSLGIFLASLLVLVLITYNAWAYTTFTQIFAPVLTRIGANPKFAQTALHGMIFSIGGSLWGTSPILLLAVPSTVSALRQGKERLTYALMALLLIYAVGHAFLTGQHWFGGLSYPPRFLVPVLPFGILLTLPILDAFLKPTADPTPALLTAQSDSTSPRRQGGVFSSLFSWKILVILLMLFSFSIQVIAVLSFTSAYVTQLPPEANSLSEWSGGLNDPRYLRWLLLPQTWGNLGFDTAWQRLQAPYFSWGYLTLLGLCLLILWRWQRERLRWIVYALGLILMFFTAYAFRSLYQQDPDYWAQTPELFQVLDLVQQEAQAGEPLILADLTYDRFIMNYNHGDAIRPIVLGFQQGEAVSPQMPARIQSDYPADLLELYVPRVLDHLANEHERLWLLAHNSQYLTWTVRPVEQYLNTYYYLIRQVETANPAVRLLEYATIPAPNRFDLRLPEYRSDLRYGDAIKLEGFTLPRGTSYQAGDVVPMTLYWQTENALSEDYIIASFIVKTDASYPPIQGIDSAPQGGFAPTTSWQVAVPIVENRAMVLPEDAPVGEYHLWLVFYRAGSGGTERLPVTAGQAQEDTIGILPISLQILPES